MLLWSDRQQLILENDDAEVLHAGEVRGLTADEPERERPHRGEDVAFRVPHVLRTPAEAQAVAAVHHQRFSLERRDAERAIGLARHAPLESLARPLGEREVLARRRADEERLLVDGACDLHVAAEAARTTDAVTHLLLEARGLLHVGEGDAYADAALVEVPVEIAAYGEDHALVHIERPHVLVVLARLPLRAFLNDPGVVLAAVILPVPLAREEGIADLVDEPADAVVVVVEQVAVVEDVPQLILRESDDRAVLVGNEQRDASDLVMSFDDVAGHGAGPPLSWNRNTDKVTFYFSKKIRFCQWHMTVFLLISAINLSP